MTKREVHPSFKHISIVQYSRTCPQIETINDAIRSSVSGKWIGIKFAFKLKRLIELTGNGTKMRTAQGGQMKVKKGIFKKCFILQFLIVGIFIIIGFAEFRAGEEFQVNTYTEGPQGYPAVAMDESGYFAITWIGYEQDGSTEGIFAQRFKINGKPIGPEFQVNTYTESAQVLPAVAMDERGNFVITWESLGQDGDDYGIFAQMFNKNGEPIGEEFQVNTNSFRKQTWPAVAMDAKGNFVITWEGGGDGSLEGIFAQRFNKNGEPIGEEFQVNTYTKDRQEKPAISVDVKGNFVITWHSYGQDGSEEGVFAQRFNKEGKPLGPELQVNSYTKFPQEWPAVAMHKNGNFVITWHSLQDGSCTGIFAKMYKKQEKSTSNNTLQYNH